MKTKFSAYPRNLFNTFAFVIVLYMALQYPQPLQTYAQNVFVFFSWVMAVGYLVIILEKGDGYTKIVQAYLDGKHLPKWMDTLQYIGFLVFLVAYGWWWTAIAWLIITGTDGGIREEAMKIEKNNHDTKNLK